MGELDFQIAVRVSPELRQLLEADADAHGRTVAQSIRYYLRAALTDPPPAPLVSDPEWIEEVSRG